MNEIKYEPIGRAYLTTYQKKDMRIRRLRHWVITLAVADAVYTILAAMVIYGAVVK